MYQPQEIKQRLDQISVGVAEQDGGSQAEALTMGDAFCDPVIRKSGWIGCLLAMF